MTRDQDVLHKLIEAERIKIDAANHNINKIAESAIPEFHFLDHQVSTFWSCEESPIGWCVWDISDHGFDSRVRCHFCGGPVERK